MTETGLKEDKTTKGAIQLLRNAMGGGGCQLSQKNALRRCKVQRYYHYEGVTGWGSNSLEKSVM